jgi:hypothetical protein
LILYPWYFDPPTHGISTPLPIVFRTPYPWYIDPLTHGVSNPLLWYYESLSLGRNEGGSIYHEGGSKYNDEKSTPGSIYHMKIDPGVNIPWGSKCHMTTGLSKLE